MALQDMKIYLFNTIALGLSLTNIEVTLRNSFAYCNYNIYNTKNKK